MKQHSHKRGGGRREGTRHAKISGAALSPYPQSRVSLTRISTVLSRPLLRRDFGRGSTAEIEKSPPESYPPAHVW